MSTTSAPADPMGSAAEREHVEKRHDARTADMRVIERRKTPRQTRAQFMEHVETYCANKKGKKS